MRFSEIVYLFEDAVVSSWLADLSYKNGNVTLTTADGRLYTVYDVPENVFDAWLNAPSKGQFFHKQIKDRYIVS